MFLLFIEAFLNDLILKDITNKAIVMLTGLPFQDENTKRLLNGLCQSQSIARKTPLIIMLQTSVVLHFRVRDNTKSYLQKI